MSASYRFTDNGAPGLLKYGLHNELLSSDSSDTDYNPDSVDSSACDTESEDEVIPARKKVKKKIRLKQINKVKKRKQFLSDSPDSDDNSQDNHKRITTRGVEARRVIREKSFVKHVCPPRSDTWSTLPTEVLALIFSHVLYLDKGARYLCRCGEVCQNWYSVVSQSISWQRNVDLSFIGEDKVANDNLLEKLSNTILTETKGLNLCGWMYVTSAGITSVANHCPKLEYLNISNCQRNISKIIGDNLVELAENTNLKRVDFSNLRICSGYSLSVVKFIKIRGEHLTHLNLSENASLGSAVVTCICENCSNLKVLNLSNTSVRNICFISLQRTCNKLTELYLANLALETKSVHSSTSDTNNNRNNSEIQNPGFPNLKILSVAKSQPISWFTDKLVQTILRTSLELCTLDLRGIRSITEKGLDIPSQGVERLFLSRTNVSLKTIEVICHKWKDILWDLDLSWVDAYGTPFDVLINHLIAGVEPCHKIRNLNLSGTAVTDAGVESILSKCLVLECLDLTSCRGIARGNKRFHNGMEAIERLRNFYNNH